MKRTFENVCRVEVALCLEVRQAHRLPVLHRRALHPVRSVYEFIIHIFVIITIIIVMTIVIRIICIINNNSNNNRYLGAVRAVRTADDPQAVWVSHGVHLTHILKSQRPGTFTIETQYRELLLMFAAVTDCCCEPLPHLMSDIHSQRSAP
jgi:hypothetical protein